MDFIYWFLTAASQKPSAAVDALQDSESHLWPYFVAIGAMSTVVVTLFGLLMKLTRSHAEEIKNLNKVFIDASEEKSKRVAEEFDRKDKNLFDWATKTSTMLERVANELSKMNDVDRRP